MHRSYVIPYLALRVRREGSSYFRNDHDGFRSSRLARRLGDNVQGKTNLLEEIFVVASLRSFRTAKLSDLVALVRVSEVVRRSAVSACRPSRNRLRIGAPESSDTEASSRSR
jgi:recombinational DNA repair ATPase RecF